MKIWPFSNQDKDTTDASASVEIEKQAWQHLEDSMIRYRGRPVGTVAARDPDIAALNYDQVFTRDFAVSACAFLLRGETEIVRHFLEVMVQLQAMQPHMNCFRPAKGLMPASFKVVDDGNGESLEADFGEHAIARVAPVDSGMWWLILLRMYGQATGDRTLAASADFQRAIRLLLDLMLTPRFDMFPTLLVPDGSFMIDRRMGVYGHPLDIQALFFIALRAARELLDSDEDGYRKAATERLGHLQFHLRNHYWIDLARVNAIYRSQVDEYGDGGANPFNIQPESIPPWLPPWLPDDGGYFAGNLGPGRMDFRCFLQGNLWAVISSLASTAQAEAIMRLVEQRWDDLIARMPAKACFPAAEGDEWRTLTGSDPKNVAWSYHNGGSWPFLLWLISAAAVKTGRTEMAHRALEIAGPRLVADDWPEYYDGRHARLVGKQARRFQTWSIAGYLAAAGLHDRPDRLALIAFEEEPAVTACAADAAKMMARAMGESSGY